ncbi:PilZ domain-containing protein [Fontibacillus phaseoli]|uniref:PilZ domain-containing protein n=1 Tax=Fontibacillus phaseoli TaxID=1416533 RepID=A0A369BEX5_9BACL|nr:PilZ domain-containing protein [Fontibacillus phaseoli]RCX19825.1 PilZ domain-containing protein [Fontibacillus phaseoli]
MNSRRNEPFRYTINPPMDCWIEIKSIDFKPVSSKLAEAELIDISKSGCRIKTQLNLHAENHSIGAAVHFQLSEENYTFLGEIRWQKPYGSEFYHYGLSLQLTSEEKEKINVELRSLAAARRIVVM